MTQALLLAFLLAVTSLSPGLLIVRKLRWNPLEKLCGAIAVSLALVYVVALITFLFHLGNAVRWAYAVAGVSATIVCFGDMRALLAIRGIRRAGAAFLLTLTWTLALLALSRHYAGGTWSQDWIVHYRKSLASLAPSTAEPIGLDRPPAMNLIWSYYLGLAGTGFENFQLAGTFLNTLIVLPCCLLAGALLRRGRRSALLVGALFMLNPLFTVNATYTWTKLLAGFYSLLGIWFYLAAMRKRDAVRLAWSAGCLAMGCLVHFAGVPYAAYVAVNCLLSITYRSWPGARAALTAAGCGAVVLASWYGWTLMAFGPRANVAANPTVGFFARHSPHENAERVAQNIVNTVVPLPLRMRGTWFVQPSRFGHIRDHAFMAYEDNLLLSMGSAGGIVAGVITVSLLRRRGAARPGVACAGAALLLVLAVFAVPAVRNVVFVALPNVPLALAGIGLATWALTRACTGIHRGVGGLALTLSTEHHFWREFLFIVPLLAIVAQDRSSEFGVTHICLQPLTLLGVTLVAAALPTLPRTVRVIVAIGAAVDFAVGVFLHFALQHADPRTAGLSDQAVANWSEKHAAGLTFVGDHFGAVAPVIEASLLIGAAALVALILRSNRLRARGRRRACGS